MGTIDMSGLVVRLNDSSLLYDTKNISYGLVKSGYLAYVENWRRLELRGINVDPNIGSSWIDSPRSGDDQYGFTIDNAEAPIVFLVGKGVGTGVKVSGTSKTYLFSGATASTKYYCFDLMKDDALGGPSLKTRDINQKITFNSGQLPLNVVAAIQAPLPGPVDRFGNPVTAYVNGRNERLRYQSASVSAILHCVVDIQMPSSEEYAAFLPWSRSCGVVDYDYIPGAGAVIYGVAEGAFGRVGGISFFFSPPGRTTEQYWTQTQQANISYYLLPTDRYPTALVIKTAGLPFPFN